MPTLLNRSGQTPFRTAFALYALCAVAAASAAVAQVPPLPPAHVATGTAAVASVPMKDAANANAGRTRDEVVAELLCACASGELDFMAMQSHGLPSPPVNRAVPECDALAQTAVAGGAAAP
ncbi:DUF4148 domain-containing protein [Acidovorax sp. SUPP3334]|uniref:DUF4148 domain-containing protein n=1 Tax=Acidovorax sp. SUPP3334 TaxID=2920881 RepID=UPI0023DE395F|nr:DUF4148 domain-containing protein [Acidovorax sp. SUPP3334]GKT23336.1 DUF4148 domain-containing protein [Acidovorax sp. SUPP3334]